MTFVLEVLLAIAVVLAWIATAGLLGTREPLARLHSATYLALTSGLFVTLALFISDPISQFALKAVLTFLALAITGAVTTHALGRAVHTRRSSSDEP